MRIEKVTRYTVDGMDFATEAKARDYVDGLINNLITKACVARGFTVSECVKITEAVLSNRYALADALGVMDWTDE